MKKICALILAVLLTLSLAGCGGYTSSYKAFILVHSNEPDSGFMTFDTFEGRMVFKFSCADGQRLKYAAELEEGDLTVYYDCGDGRTELCSLRGGEGWNSETGPLKKGKLYVIVESAGKCAGGDLTFELE